MNASTQVLYNTDTQLWRNSAPTWRARKVELEIRDGHIYAGPEHGFVARFASNADAANCLLDAGYQFIHPNKFLA